MSHANKTMVVAVNLSYNGAITMLKTFENASSQQVSHRGQGTTPQGAAVAHSHSKHTKSLAGGACNTSQTSLLDRVRKDLIGNHTVINTPFGERPLVYADYTASGRAIGFLEDNIRRQVLPHYANTHTDASHTSKYTNHLREQAREQIRHSVNGTNDDKVIFCGSGATAAINKLIDILGLRLPSALDERYVLRDQIPELQRPVILVGPYEHHSNELPWRETIADVVRIDLDASGGIDQAHLAEQLQRYQAREVIIGSFSAGSNVTGVLSDIEGITSLLKTAGALSFWDFAAAGPYVAIDMNATKAAIDAAFISPHKFIGGPGTPGILVAKSALLNNAIPAVVGGGTVAYVSPTRHRYLAHPEHREEAGTPAIVESIRAGAVFALKDAIGAEAIEAIERHYYQRAFEAFRSCSAIDLLGGAAGHRLPIFSMRFRHKHQDLHYGFAAVLLNDLFGIQARGGCSCAGPYGHSLLGIDDQLSVNIDGVVSAGLEAFKPGWLRINLHYAAREAEVTYLLNAVMLVAEQGWRLLPSYELTAKGDWQYRDHLNTDVPSLASLLNEPTRAPQCTFEPSEFNDYLLEGSALLTRGSPAKHVKAAMGDSVFSSDIDSLRWFITAREAAIELALGIDGEDSSLK